MKKKTKLRMKNLILLGISLFFNVVLFAQEFYLLNSINQIYSYNYSDGSANFLVTVDSSVDTLLDIAYASPDHMYGVTNMGMIVDIDMLTGDFDIVFEFQNGQIHSGLVYNTDNNLVMINSMIGAIITFSLDSNTIISEFIIGTGNPGDLTYYQGNLLFQGTSSEDLLAYDGSIVKSIACADLVGYWGLSNFITDCNTNLLLAMDGGGRVWEYDIEGQTYEQIDDLASEIGGVYGATTVNEQFAYDCNLVNLEEVYCEFLREDRFFLCEYNTATQTNSIKVVDPSLNLDHLFELTMPGSILWDIAFSSSGELYGITDNQQIVQIDGEANVEVIAQLQNVSGYASMVGNTSNELILIGSTEAKILTFSLDSNIIISETEIPEGSPGDGTYYKGNLLYQGIAVYDMYAFDGTTAETIACNNVLPFRGMANLFESCQSNGIIAFKEDGRFYHFDVEGNGLTFGVDRSSEVDLVYGATTRTEYLASACPLEALEILDCGPAPVTGEFFVCDYNPSNGISAIKMVDTDLNVTPVVELDMEGDYLLDIAFSSAELLYGITANENIVQIHPDGSFTLIAELDGATGYASMVGNTDNQLILVGGENEMILTFSLDTNTIVSEVEIEEGTHGDVTYFKGNLVYPGTQAEDIWGFDGNEEIPIICNDLSPMVGFSQIFVDCELSLTWAVSDVGRIYEYDSVENEFTTIANLTAQFEVVYGSTTRTEYLASGCNPGVLEDAKCLLSTPSEELASLVLYPNPVTNKLWIQSGKNFQEITYEIYSVQGQKIMQGTYQNGIDFSEVAAGVYFVKLRNANSSAFDFRSVIRK